MANSAPDATATAKRTPEPQGVSANVAQGVAQNNAENVGQEAVAVAV